MVVFSFLKIELWVSLFIKLKVVVCRIGIWREIELRSCLRRKVELARIIRELKLIRAHLIHLDLVKFKFFIFIFTFLFLLTFFY